MTYEIALLTKQGESLKSQWVVLAHLALLASLSHLVSAHLSASPLARRLHRWCDCGFAEPCIAPIRIEAHRLHRVADRTSCLVRANLPFSPVTIKHHVSCQRSCFPCQSSTSAMSSAHNKI